jgi:hypothetical protein
MEPFTGNLSLIYDTNPQVFELPISDLITKKILIKFSKKKKERKKTIRSQVKNHEI